MAEYHRDIFRAALGGSKQIMLWLNGRRTSRDRVR